MFREPDPTAPRPDDGADFADEHSDTSFADEMSGGPESARDPDSPTGHAGMDG